MIDLRLRQATCQPDLPFGGISILLVGDNGQLQPVGGMEVFRQSDSPKLNEAEGQALFFLFMLVVKLETLMRQKDDVADAGQTHFKEILLIAPFGIYSVKDWRFLVDNHPVTSKFDNAIHLFATNAKKVERNEKRLLELGQPIKRFKAINNCEEACKKSSDEFNGLESELFLARGSEGVINRACGTVIDVVFLDKPTLPGFAEFLVVELDSYSGPSFFPISPLRSKYIAIAPTTVVSKDYFKLSRTQYPVVLAYGLSIHKSQGASFDQCVVDLGDTEFSGGLLLNPYGSGTVELMKLFSSFDHNPVSIWGRLYKHFDARQHGGSPVYQLQVLSDGLQLLASWVITDQQMFAVGEYGSPVEVMSRLLTEAPISFQALFKNYVSTQMSSSLAKGTQKAGKNPFDGNQFVFPLTLSFGNRKWKLSARIRATEETGAHFRASFERDGAWYWFDDLIGVAKEVTMAAHIGYKHFGYQCIYIEIEDREE
ncbi:hypothetical protein BCR33DRAFT_732861 [Rhizoclosmatium globosum]|uniref:ATP-dependent DNA helicase n=1 Tax=Rhizoclosmatium globosum TaxID=329046 RepID=A0A1Y2D1A9_9FUNG|nr:hypothetical protein BCR33DRAFT_732861 [Rhizoclosmatium globosum]|eukprot:ORY53069.1 hypothetical protein BCR33DRAFT_732861 [Rhizoclosmatium globosum]